jgi:hypothetical protein
MDGVMTMARVCWFLICAVKLALLNLRACVWHAQFRGAREVPAGRGGGLLLDRHAACGAGLDACPHFIIYCGIVFMQLFSLHMV